MDIIHKNIITNSPLIITQRDFFDAPHLRSTRRTFRTASKSGTLKMGAKEML